MSVKEFYINIQSIRNLAEAAVYNRGEKLAASGAVQSVTRRADLLIGKVTGSSYMPYGVSIQFAEGDPVFAGCTCPYDQGDWCKHTVALALFAATHPDAVAVEETVAELVADLSAPDLVRLVVDLADASPDLVSRIRYFVKDLALAAARPVGPVAQGSVQVDMALIRDKISAGLRTDLSPQTVIAGDLAMALDLAYAGDAAQSLEILRMLATALALRLDRSASDATDRDYDDYDRYSSWGDPYEEGVELEEFDALAKVDEVWAEVCLALSLLEALTEAQAQFIRETVEHLEEEIQASISELVEMDLYISNFEEGAEVFNLTSSALTQGWRSSHERPTEETTPGEVAAFDESDEFDEFDDDEFDDNEFDDDEFDDESEDDEFDYSEFDENALSATGGAWHLTSDYADVRLRVLARMERYDDYLALAEADGQMVALVQMLAQLGRDEEAESRALALALTPALALKLAQSLRTEGLTIAAMRVAERGLDADFDTGRAILGRWLAELAHQEGNVELAIKAAVLTLLQSPTLVDFRTVRTVAGERWPDLRPDVIDRLRQIQAGWGTGLCDIFLEEGLVKDAINAAPSFLHFDFAKRLFPVAIPVDPDWVIKQSIAQATPIMNGGKSAKYAEAVDWLRYVRDAYRNAGQANIWAEYLAQLRAVHGKKYKLMGLLKQLD